MKIKNILKYYFLLILLLLLYNGKPITGLTGCESLSSELCLAAYPLCQTLILTSCCLGQTPLCLNIDTVINYSTNKKKEIQSCLRNIETGIYYELWGDMDDIPGYEILPIPNVTCKDLGCEQKGFDCVYEPTTLCVEPTSPCCLPQPTCVNFLSKFNFDVLQGTVNCDLPCQDGFICRIITDLMICTPTNCSLIDCPPGTECLPLQGLDIVSCFKKIQNDHDPTIQSNLTCADITCPPGFICSGDDQTVHSPISNTTCIPNTFNIIGNDFECENCPVEGNFTWTCKFFGWSGFCIEIDYVDYGNEFECFGSTCLPNQICNSTSQQCEFGRCTNTTCHESMDCFQYHPTSPKICSSMYIFPSVSYPVSLEPFIDHFNDTVNVILP